MNEAEMEKSNLLRNIVDFYNNTYESAYTLYEGRELTLNAFKSGIFPIKATKGEWFKTITPKQILKRLPVAFAQVETGNTSENFLNEIRQIIYFWTKKLLKSV